MSILKEFREFAVRGNVVDLAVGVIIGGAFQKIVDSLVGDIIMPMLSRLVGRLDFTQKFWVIGDGPAGTAMTLDALKKAGVPVLAWGNFITISLNFLILAFVIFLMVKQINRLRRLNARDEDSTPVADTAPPEDVLLLREIRDALKKP